MYPFHNENNKFFHRCDMAVNRSAISYKRRIVIQMPVFHRLRRTTAKSFKMNPVVGKVFNLDIVINEIEDRLGEANISHIKVPKAGKLDGSAGHVFALMDYTRFAAEKGELKYKMDKLCEVLGDKVLPLSKARIVPSTRRRPNPRPRPLEPAVA
jgi:hypothetical protein